jgi:uncharacterized repeat protein (TIGR03803 family)
MNAHDIDDPQMGGDGRRIVPDTVPVPRLSRIQKSQEDDMHHSRIDVRVAGIAALLAAAVSSGAAAAEAKFSLLYAFEVANPTTGASALGSQPDTRPVLGHDQRIYGMTYTGGANGNGVIYRYDRNAREYTVLHTFSALAADGTNADGANPGVALTRGPDDTFYGMASAGGAHGTGTIFKISASGKFTVLHAFSALDANLHNADGASPLRTLVLDGDGRLYGTTRLGGENTCGPRASGCGVAWTLSAQGHFSVIHQFQTTEGHAASLLPAEDGNLGVIYRMEPSGAHFEVLYRFTPVDGNGNNADGANCYEPLVETRRGVFYGAANAGGVNGSGTVFRYTTEKAGELETVHAFGAVDAAGVNGDGANPYASLTPGPDGMLYSTASYGGAGGSGVVYRVKRDGPFEVLYAFSAVNPVTGANTDGNEPDYGVLYDEADRSFIGMTDYGGNGSTAGAIGNGTLYRLRLQE